MYIFARKNENHAKMKKLKTGELIQQAAADLFQKFGFEKTSMDEIAKKAHKAKRSIYNHFGNKEDLFCSSAKMEIEHMQTKLQEIVEDQNQLILPRLRQYLLLRMELIAASGTLQVAMKNNMLNNDDYRFEDLKQAMNHFNKWEHDAFKHVWYAKTTSDTKEQVEQQTVAFADMLQITLNGLSYSFFVEGKYEQYKSSYEMLIDLIVNSVFQSFISLFSSMKEEETNQ